MTPVKEAALEAGLPIYQPEKLSGSQELEDLLALGADGIVTAAFGQFLPSRLLEAMKFSVNVHASLLKKYRGGAPIHYAIMNGDKSWCDHHGNGQRDGCWRYDFFSRHPYFRGGQCGNPI